MFEHRILHSGWTTPTEVEPFERQRAVENEVFALNRLIDQGGYDNPEVAKRYYELYSRRGLEPKIVRHFEGLFDQLIPAEQIEINGVVKPMAECTALEFGSGPGHVAEVLGDRFGKVIAVDKAKAMVDFVNNKFGMAGRIEGRQGEFGGRLPVEDSSVETVISFNTIDELAPEEEDNFLREIARVIKSGGLALINRVVNADNLAMNSKFNRERASELKSYDLKRPRHYVFITSTLEPRLNELLDGSGIKAEMTAIDDPSDPRYSVVKITFNKINSNETKIN